MKTLSARVLSTVVATAWFAVLAPDLEAQPIATAPASCTLTNLRCECLVEPLGLDVREPALGWKLVPADPRAGGQCQTAYQILVASSAEALQQNRADLWDSKWVKSAESQNVAYRGQPLRAGLACHWKVRIRDERGAVTGWSPPSFWTMGPLGPADWTAQWVGTGQVFERKPGSPPPDNTIPDPWMRRVFVLDSRPRRASVTVASVGYHELYVNGRLASEDVLSPAVSDHTQRARFITYDIRRHLQPGRNVLAFWLGASWSLFPPHQTSDKPACPIVIAQADIESASGNFQRIGTDAHWRWHASPNTMLGVWDFMHFGGEQYDAGKEMPGWNLPDFDDRAWKPVLVVHPRLKLSAQKVEGNRPMLGIEPVGLSEPKPGVYRVDFGVNFTGWLEARVRGAPGDRILFKWSERDGEPMTHNLHSAYLVGPSGEGTFRNRFNYGAGRWLQVEGLRQKPELQDFHGSMVRTAYGRTTQFECSLPLLNRIYETALWTFENLSLGGYVVDCAQRERMGYGGDGHATLETGLDNYDLRAFYTKWNEDWRDVQGTAAAWGVDRKEGEAGSGKRIEPGNLPYTAPTYWGGGGPAWSGFCVTLPWELYRRTGDKRVLAASFPTVQRWLAFLEGKSVNHLLRRWGGEWDFLGDWLWPGAQGVNGDSRETLFFNNCYWVYNLTTAARMADALGQKHQAQLWRARAAAIRTTIHREFWNPTDPGYVNGSQAYLAIADLIELPPSPALRLALRKRLEREIQGVHNNHFWGGITGGYFLIKDLLESNRNDLLFAMATREDYPGWGDMLRRGATTFWEDWEGRLSQCHSSYLHIGFWFVQGLAGIRPDPRGADSRHFLLRPACDGSVPLEWVKCQQETPYGILESNWDRKGGQTTLELSIPPNTTADLVLSVPPSARIVPAGASVPLAAGVRITPTAAGRVVVLPPGHHSFVVR